MIRLLILLLAASQAFAQSTTELVAQGKRGLTESNVGNMSGTWNMPPGGKDVIRLNTKRAITINTSLITCAAPVQTDKSVTMRCESNDGTEIRFFTPMIDPRFK